MRAIQLIREYQAQNTGVSIRTVERGTGLLVLQLVESTEYS